MVEGGLKVQRRLGEPGELCREQGEGRSRDVDVRAAVGTRGQDVGALEGREEEFHLGGPVPPGGRVDGRDELDSP